MTLYPVSRAFCAAFLKIFFGLRVVGRENIPAKGGFILAGNHVSYLDPPAVGSGCLRSVHFMARHDLFKIPVLGWWLRSVGVFEVKRESADVSAMKQAIRCLKNGEGLALFPQGRRSGIENLEQDIQAGVGFIAQKSAVPVVPVFVKGTEKALPKGARFFKRALITVRFGKSIVIGKEMSYQDAAAWIAVEIKKLSEL